MASYTAPADPAAQNPNIDDPAAEAAATMAQTRQQMLQVSETVGGIPGFADVQKLLAHPTTQAVVGLARDERFTASIKNLKDHPAKQNLIYAEAGFSALVLIWWMWRQSKVQKWYGRIWVSMSTSAVYWSGALFAVPAVILGDPFIQIVRGVYEVVRASL